MDQARTRWLTTRSAEQAVQGADQWPNRLLAAWESTIGGQNQAVMITCLLSISCVDAQKIRGVLSDHGALFGLSRFEHVRVEQSHQLRSLEHRHDIVAAQTKLPGDLR